MRLLGKTAIILGMAGAMALGYMTASEARYRGAAVAAGAAGFVAGAAVGAAAANANAGYYYGPTYGYGYDSYAYEPAYVPQSYYGPVGGYPYYSGYNTNNNGPVHERVLEGHDY